VTILAFDPGATSGYAVLAKSRRNIMLEAAGTFKYREAHTGTDIWQVIRTYSPTLIVVEDWENQGKSLDMHSTWPNRVIGHVEAYASLLGIHLSLVGASAWKPSFGARANLVKVNLPVKLDAKHERIAKRLTLELGGWPQALSYVPNETLRHAVDAAGLACWVALHPSYRDC
jgi:hypothetical protein